MKNFIIYILIPGSVLFASCQEKQDREKIPPATRVELGELLFNDPILSQDNSISCASCHIPAFAFADTVAFSSGVGGKKGRRNTPSAANMSARIFFFHDGRAASLEEQAIGPMENQDEMNLPVYEAVRRLNENTFYHSSFKRLYGESANPANISNALAEFERTLETGASPFDSYMRDDSTAISISARRGHLIFTGKGKCFDCHFGPDFTGDEFKNIGLYNEKDLNDKGRYEVTKKDSDLGKFKVPGLRNVAITAPYMHNGMFKTLEEVIEYYDNPQAFVKNSINTDTLLLKPLHLTKSEKEDLVEFLESLTDKRFEGSIKKHKQNNVKNNQHLNNN